MARNYRFFLRNQDSIRQLQKQEERFLLNEQNEPEIVFQLTKVLRIKQGDNITLVPGLITNYELLITNGGAPPGRLRSNCLPGHPRGVGRGGFLEYVFDVVNASKSGIDLLLKSTLINDNELSFDLNLWLCLPNKPEKLEFILQKAVEIGVSRIVLFESDFSQMKHQLRMDRLEKIMVEAAEQSERAMVPSIELKGNLTKFLTSPAEQTTTLRHVWVALERAPKATKEQSPAATSVSANPFLAAEKGRAISVLIGPEGGFSENEKKLFHELQFSIFSLGKRILRMETAAVLSLGLAALLDA